MNRLPPALLLPLVAILCVGLASAGLWQLRQSHRKAARALMILEQKKQEKKWLEHHTPALSVENEAASAELVEAGDFLAGLRSKLQGGPTGPWNTPPPAGSVDAFFALTGVVAQLRAQAGVAQVGIKSDERFGFSTYAHEGPDVTRLARVHRQLLAAQYLVETLLASHPHALLAVRRERPAGNESRDQAGDATDFFEPNRALSPGQPGLVETEALRLEFTGPTAVLRDFLNRLAMGPEPVVVGSLEVEPHGESKPASPVVAATTGPALRPLVKHRLSRFVLTVEFVREAVDPSTTGQLPSTPSNPSPMAAAWKRTPSAASRWAGPLPQSSGKDWLYEVFTPPVIHFDPVSRAFTVAPSFPAATVPGTAAGLKLLAVRREPYRLQLAGYTGLPGSYLATFINPASTEVLLARPGRRFSGLGLTLKSVDVQKVALAGSETGPVYDVMAVAVLQEERTGQEVILNNRTRKLTDRLVAEIIFPQSAGPGAFREGETFVAEDATYRVDRIQLAPAEAVVTRTTPGSAQAETQVLQLAEASAPTDPAPKSLAQAAVPEVANRQSASLSP